MAEVVPDINDQSYQHFMTESPWSHREVMDQVAKDVDDAFGDSQDRFLVVDESANAKKGDTSVGVARQWNGRLGKVDNCQVGVFAGLGCGGDITLIDERLYLSQEWIDSPKRCDRAGIPEEERIFRTKAQLALEMIRHARRQGIRHSWVSFDGGYGKEPWLLRALDVDGETWVADVHCDQLIYPEDPCPVVPERTHPKGRSPKRRIAQTEPVRVNRWIGAQPASDWREVALRDSTKGTLSVDVLHRRVWLWDGKEPFAHCWHHHMAMVMLAMLFMLEMRREHRKDLALLSCHDVVEVLRVLLPRANVNRLGICQTAGKSATQWSMIVGLIILYECL